LPGALLQCGYNKCNTGRCRAYAGPAQQLCNVTAATLAANTPTSGTGVWTAAPGTNPTAVTFTNANDPATTVNGLTAGVYQFIWTISNAPCSSSQSTVEITVYPPTVAGTLAAAATVCATANTGSLTLTGFVSSVLRWESSVDGTTWNNIANTTSSLSYTDLTATTSYRTYVQNAVCPAVYSNAVTINVVQAATTAMQVLLSNCVMLLLQHSLPIHQHRVQVHGQPLPEPILLL
jgi:hypothetical protein